MHRYIPNLLTILRVLSAPLIGLMLLTDTSPFWAVTALIIYSIACLTDWLDGYLARRWDIVSGFGRMLDPIADKLMVILMLIVLMGTSLSGLWLALPALVIVTREIMVSGLREFMAKQDFIVHVSLAAKMKTTVQLIAIGFLIGSFIFAPDSPLDQLVTAIGLIGLWFAAFLTATTGYSYFAAALAHMDSIK